MASPWRGGKSVWNLPAQRRTAPERGCVAETSRSRIAFTGRMEGIRHAGRSDVLRLIPRCAGHSRAPIVLRPHASARMRPTEVFAPVFLSLTVGSFHPLAEAVNWKPNGCTRIRDGVFLQPCRHQINAP